MRLCPNLNVAARLLALAYNRGLIVYGRRVRGDGLELDNIILAPPLIITREEVDEVVGILDASLAAFAREFDLPAEV